MMFLPMVSSNRMNPARRHEKRVVNKVYAAICSVVAPHARIEHRRKRQIPHACFSAKVELVCEARR